MQLCSIWNIIKDTYLFIIIAWFILVIALRKHRYYKKYLLLSAFVYVAVLLYVTLLGRTIKTEPQMELSFLWEYRLAFSGSLFWISQIFDNIMLFVPMGWLYGSMRDKTSWGGAIFFGVCSSFLIELCQLVFKLGLCEFDDVLNNTVGMMVGYGIWRMSQRNTRSNGE